MDSLALVSIIIPVYNGERYMREAIDSALAQTYSNIEIIVVNDGSTDNTEDIAKSYGDKIRYFSKENGGVSSALNLGIRHMRGEYFSWLSHDDVYYPQKIEENISAIKDCPGRIVYSDYDVIDGDGTPLHTANIRKWFRSADFAYGLFPVLNGAANACTMLIPRSEFDRCGLFDENLRTSQDYDLFFKMFRGQKLVYINTPLTAYRSHGAQQTLVNPLTVAEGNALWIGMFEQLTEDEMIALNGSMRMFWREKSAMLKASTAFLDAANFALDKYNACVSMLRNAKISVIMPFYNRIDLMPKTIESVIMQTHTNWELILANDGTDDDIGVIQDIVNHDARIKLINLPHRGVSAARNSAIAVSSGEFIAFLDSDDLWRPEKLETQLNYMLDNGFAFSHTSFEQRFLNGELLASYDVSNFCGDVFLRSIHTWSICTCCVMFERTTMGEAKFPEDISMGEDICLWFHFLWRHEVGAVPDVLTTVRVQGESTSQSMDKKREALYSVIGFLMKNYNKEECLAHIGKLVYGFSTLFPTVPIEEPAAVPAEDQTDLVEGGCAVSTEELTILAKVPVDSADEHTSLVEEPTASAEESAVIADRVKKPLNPRNYPLRFIFGLKRHGVVGFWKIFWLRIWRRLKA